MAPRFQLLPPLTTDEYDALKANVAAVGILQPVVTDEHGEILDGHHRAQACDELGVEYPTVVLPGLSDDQKYEQALVLNLGRRHLTADQKRDLVAKLAETGRSVRWIASATGIPKSTVHRYLAPVPDGTPPASSDQEGVIALAHLRDLERRVETGLDEVTDSVVDVFVAAFKQRRGRCPTIEELDRREIRADVRDAIFEVALDERRLEESSAPQEMTRLVVLACNRRLVSTLQASA
jgi:ParB-like chromosome segregation protein Spo0J